MSLKKTAAWTSSSSYCQTEDKSELRSLLNNCKPDKVYTSVTELRLDCGYRIYKIDRVLDIYGQFVVAIVEGLFGEDFFLTVPLPKRYNAVLTDSRIQNYNMGIYGPLYMVRRSAPLGSFITPLDFV